MKGPHGSASSLLLLLVAGTGCPAAHHLAPDLLHKLWVLLLHLLCKLLARLDEAGQVTLLRTAAWRAQRVMAPRDHARHELLQLGTVHQAGRHGDEVWVVQQAGDV